MVPQGADVVEAWEEMSAAQRARGTVGAWSEAAACGVT